MPTRKVISYTEPGCGCRFEKREEISTEILFTACADHAELALADGGTMRLFYARQEWPYTVAMLDEAVRRLRVGCECWVDGGHESTCPLAGGSGQVKGEMNPLRELLDPLSSQRRT